LIVFPHKHLQDVSEALLSRGTENVSACFKSMRACWTGVWSVIWDHTHFASNKGIHSYAFF